MSQTTHYMAIPASILEFVERHPDILELLGSWTGRRPVLRDIPQILEQVERDPELLGDYGRLTLPTLQAFAASPHTAVLDALLPALSIDKAGPGIHFLLTGTKDGGLPPLCDLVFGGKELGTAGEVFLVRPRLLAPPQVLAIAQALQDVDDGELEARYDADRMSALDIQPNIWKKDDEALDYLLEHYEALTAYVLEAASRGHALVVSMTV